KSRAQGRGSRVDARGVIARAPFGRCGDGGGCCSTACSLRRRCALPALVSSRHDAGCLAIANFRVSIGIIPQAGRRKSSGEIPMPHSLTRIRSLTEIESIEQDIVAEGQAGRPEGVWRKLQPLLAAQRQQRDVAMALLRVIYQRWLPRERASEVVAD